MTAIDYEAKVSSDNEDSYQMSYQKCYRQSYQGLRLVYVG